jgi:antitoxin (DNA-binding transcriptional repressor) of toxin-antitoxin stability system
VITVNMHEAKTRLSELVRAVEELGETVILCRDGEEVAEIRRRKRSRRHGAARVASSARISRRPETTTTTTCP